MIPLEYLLVREDLRAAAFALENTAETVAALKPELRREYEAREITEALVKARHAVARLEARLKELA